MFKLIKYYTTQKLAINLISGNCLQRIELLNSKFLKTIINLRGRRDATKIQKETFNLKREPQIF